MGKLPYMPFYPADYIRDTRGLPPFVRGIWMDILCYLWDAKVRGKDNLPLAAWAAKCGATEAEMDLALDTLVLHNTCDIKFEETSVKIISRRMVRDDKKREKIRIRVTQHRERQAESEALRNAGMKRASNGDISEVRSHISESELEEEKKEEEKKPARSRRHVTDDEFWSALKMNPAYSHIDFESENGKMDAWILNNPGREKTRKFVLNWLNKTPKPMAVGVVPIRQKPLTAYQQMMERAKAAAEAAHG